MYVRRNCLPVTPRHGAGECTSGTYPACAFERSGGEIEKRLKGNTQGLGYPFDLAQ